MKSSARAILVAQTESERLERARIAREERARVRRVAVRAKLREEMHLAHSGPLTYRPFAHIGG